MSATSEQHVASYDVLVAGQDLPQEHKDRIKEIRVTDYLRLPDVCTVQLTYSRGQGIDTLPFDIGEQLEVRLGAIGELAPVTLFKGQVLKIEHEFGAGCSVTVRAYDRSHVLHRSRKVRTFQNQTSSDIVEKIAKDAGLTPRCEPSGEPHDFVQQDNETDWDFIWRLAERIGFEIGLDGTTLRFGPPAPQGTTELEYPDTLRSFSPRITAVQQVERVTLLAQDPKTKQAIDVAAAEPALLTQIGISREKLVEAFPGAEVHVATEPVKSKGEGQALVQALLDRHARGFVAAEGVAPGNPKIKAGTLVKVSGVGQRFSGTYLVASSTHVLRSGGYETRFANSPAHTLLGAIGNSPPSFAAQLVLGIVTNNDDPEGRGRVRVRYPALGSDIEGAWARIATVGAGNERGLLMLPVPGEEVLIGFEHGDTTRPYVLGSLFNGRDAPGDDLLQDKDGSFAVKSDKKIYAESVGDYTIKSGANLVVEVAGKASMKSTQGFEIAGASLSIKGDTEVTIEGATTLTLKCGASQIQLSASGVTVSGPTINLG
jgi:phage protein D/phage baseplate assembly protein gpV